jgi:hypothetical protein
MLNRFFTALGQSDQVEHRDFFNPPRLMRVARMWLGLAVALLLAILWRQTQVGWSDGNGAPFGEDFINFWSGARLALEGRSTIVYDIAAFHAYENSVVGAEIGLYHYSYPPVAWLLTAPFAALPYLAGWAAWQVGGWLAFALALRRVLPGRWLLLSLAAPVIFLNASAGQNGCWTAAAIGWGLILLRSRPMLAGAILAFFVIKPQLGWLIPLALLSGRQWRALASFMVVSVTLLLVSLVVFGSETWLAYLGQAQLLKRVILEDGFGTWHRMLSVFVVVRHGGGTVAVAYVMQGLASLIIAAFLVRQWWRCGPSEQSFAILIMGMLAGSLYVSDYDCVMAIFPVCWRWRNAGPVERIALAGLIVLPLVAASLALATQFAVGAALLWWPLALAARDGAVFWRGGYRSHAQPDAMPDNVSLPGSDPVLLL